MADHADSIVAAIKRPGRGPYLESLFQWAGIVDPFPSAQARASAVLASASQHLTFETAQVAFTDKQHPWDDIVLEQVTFGPQASLPFLLDATDETPGSARLKLSKDTVGGDPAGLTRGDFRVSYFRFDATVIELTFRPGLVGITRVLAARLG